MEPLAYGRAEVTSILRGMKFSDDLDRKQDFTALAGFPQKKSGPKAARRWCTESLHFIFVVLVLLFQFVVIFFNGN